ncbi:MAG: Mur ligase domain-containing protein [Candidatus Colwellbacteria bacterium]
MKIYLIGIGGIGVSALARYFKSEGHDVSGSDIAGSALIDDLKGEGIECKIGLASAENVPGDVDRVIYSPAIETNHPEMEQAKLLGAKIQSYPEALGEVSRNHFTLAVTGSHGKSTTTSLLALMMIEAGLDPTVVVGTKLVEFGGSNFRKGKSKYLVIEADDFNRSFYQYQPQIAVVTNVDEEHLDTYGDMDGVIEGFHHFLGELPSESNVILNKGDQHTSKISEGVQAKLHYFDTTKAPKWPLQIPGEFNQQNAEAAWRAAELVGVTRSQAEAAVSKYKGAWRRLEPLEAKDPSLKDMIVFSDYGHHPTEIRATLSALKERYPSEKITLVFQPHQARRLTQLFDKFASAFDDADKVILLPVYKVEGRDEEGGRTSGELKDALIETGKGEVGLVGTIVETLDRLDKGVVVFMGAGDIDGQVRQYFKSKLIHTPT